MESWKEGLAADEFLILKDDMCHIVVGIGQSIKVLPSTLFLTNKKILVQTPYDDKKNFTMILNEITKCTQMETNDCYLLEIRGNSARNSIRIFIPEPEHQQTFAEIISKLCEAQEKGQAEFDAVALGIQRRVLETKSLNAFYSEWASIKNNLVVEPPATELPEGPAIAMFNQIQPTPVHFIDVIDDIITRSELLFFAIIGFLVLFFTLLFERVSFGVCCCGVLSAIITKVGFNLIFSKDTQKAKQKLKQNDERWKKRFKRFIGVFENFKLAFDRRFLWKNPRQTLEVEFFLIATCFMFAAFDPALILAISMFGLGFVERWDPFGFGSLWEIITSLFSF